MFTAAKLGWQVFVSLFDEATRPASARLVTRRQRHGAVRPRRSGFLPLTICCMSVSPQLPRDARADPGGDGSEPDDSEAILSVKRALMALQVFSTENPSLTLSDIAKMIGVSRGTTRRILITFEEMGFVRRTGRQFTLTPRVLRLGYGYVSSLPFWERAQPHMRELADAVEESSSIAVLDGPDIAYVARVPSRRQLTTVLTVGSRLPAYATSLGHVLLAGLPPTELRRYLDTVRLERLTPKTIIDKARLAAELEKVRRAGYSIANGERDLGVRSAAAPIVDRFGSVIAALNVSTAAGRVSMAELRTRIVPEVMATAKIISEELGYE
jgi:IclR family pca regulon transcriptional regulator